MKPRILVALASWLMVLGVRAADAPAAFELRDHDRVVFVGDGFIEGEQDHGWIELMLTTRFPTRDVTFRNLGWSGDTPAGDSRLGLSLVQAGKEPADEGWTQLQKQLADAKPTVVFVGYGMASSFDGAAGLLGFRFGYTRLLFTLEQIAPGARVVLVGPIPHEKLGAPWPDPAGHNAQLATYDEAIRDRATRRHLAFVSLFDALRTPMDAAGAEKLTQDGIHLNDRGYRVVAQIVEDQLFGKAGAWRTSAQVEPLRAAIRRKNEEFFHRSRPANMAYIFGFRKAEQGRNAAEVLKFDESIAAEEKRIAQLRALRPASVPEIPQRAGNLVVQHTVQPHPQFEVADGFEVTLWAENPTLHKPIQMNFDARGRLWVASSEVYPQIEPGQAATDQIVVLEDTTGAGRADKATVFADGLLIPTGVVPGDGGCYVAQSTELLHFVDTDGDGKADVRRTVLSGFGTEDTHHNLHTLHWGPDGRLYMNQSVYTRTNAETPHGVVRLKAGGTFRFDPRDERMEILFRGWVNAWGHQFDDFGQSFVTDGAGFQGISWAVPGATYFTLAPARRQLQSISPGSYAKFAGLEIVRSAHFPADWQGDLITADFRAHRVVRFKVTEQGSGYVTREMPDVLRATADSFRPIDAKLGPDGALYIADWSNPIIQHGEVDFRDPRRDKEHGRIWRIAVKGRAPLPVVDFTRLTVAALLEKLLSPNGYDQERAARVLVERGAEKVLPDLDAWTKRQTTEFALLRALWTYQALNRLPVGSALAPDRSTVLTADRSAASGDPTTVANLSARLLVATDPKVRAAAVRALPAGAAIADLAKLVADENPRVRLETVRALGQQGTARAAELALGVLDRPMDPFLDYALWLTINELAEPWIAAVKAGEWKIAGREKQLEFALKGIEPALASEVLGGLLERQPLVPDGAGPWIELIGAAGGPKELRRLLDQILRGEFTPPAQQRGLAALTEAARLRSVKPAGDLASLDPLLVAKDDNVRLAAIPLAGAWKILRFAPSLFLSASNPNASAAERTAAFAALREIGDPQLVRVLRSMATDTHVAPDSRREAALTAAALDFSAALPEVVALLQAPPVETDVPALWRALLGIRGAGAKLAAELPKAGLSREVASAGLRPAREGTQNQALVPVLMKLAGLSLASVQLSGPEMLALAQEALAKGDAARGERLYRRAELACTVCHAIGGAGGRVGPDLSSIGASAPPDYLVESLLYPSAKIKEGFHSVLITKKNGQEFSGLVTKEAGGEILLRDASNREVSIAAQDVAKRADVGSLMPAGLTDSLLPEERLDLVKFLAQLGRSGDYDAPKGGVARAWRLYMVTAVNEHLGVERAVAGDPTLSDWVPMLSLVNGTLPREAIETTFPNRSNNRGIFAATRLQSAAGGPVTLNLGGAAQGIFVNGRAVKLTRGAPLTIETRAGVNMIVVQWDEASDGIKLSAGEGTFVMDLL